MKGESNGNSVEVGDITFCVELKIRCPHCDERLTKRSKAVEQVEVAERPYIEAPATKGLAALRRARKKRWAKIRHRD